jgi:hypothetical protein
MNEMIGRWGRIGREEERRGEYSIIYNNGMYNIIYT